MKGATTLVFLALLATPAGAASVPGEAAPTLMGHAYYDVTTGVTTWETNPAPLAAVDIYRNTGTAALVGVSSTDTLAGWGDELLSADTGTLDENDFTVFNSQLSAGPLLSAAFDIFYYRAPEPFDFLGTYTTSVIHFGSGLPVGFYSIVTVTGLSALHINLDTTDLLIVQQVHSHLGPATRLGVVLMSPPAAVGANTSDMYIAASTIGPPGFYNVNGVPSADPGYRVAVLEPVPVNGKTWGSIKGKYR